MDKLMLKIDDNDFLNENLKKYLINLDGIFNCLVSPREGKIYVDYESSIISLKVLKLEILYFLDALKTPSILAFSKYSHEKTQQDTIIIKDICCEYCLKNFINDLFDQDEIVSVDTNFDHHNMFNVNIFITYKENMIDKTWLENLEKNNYCLKK